LDKEKAAKEVLDGLELDAVLLGLEEPNLSDDIDPELAALLEGIETEE